MQVRCSGFSVRVWGTLKPEQRTVAIHSRVLEASLITVFCGVGSYRGPHDQYFYRYPEKIIAGQITPPRFLLNNQALIETHIHPLILESLGMAIK